MTQPKGFLNHVGSSGANADAEKRMLMQLQSMLFVNDSRLRSNEKISRRLGKLKNKRKKNIGI